MKLPTPSDRSRRRAVVGVRFGVGIWLLALAAFLCWSGFWWGLLLTAPAALHFWLGRRLRRGAR
jgi:hypothetical protein